MTRPSIDRFLDRLHREYPSYPPFLRPYRREDPDIEYFIDVLNVPDEQHLRVAFRVLDLAHEVYGEEPIPFHIAPLDPEQSAKYLPQALEQERKRKGRLGA